MKSKLKIFKGTSSRGNHRRGFALSQNQPENLCRYYRSVTYSVNAVIMGHCNLTMEMAL